NDPTGHRRFWPIRITEPIDVDWINKHRDAIWAQALALYTSGAKWWIDEGSAEAALLRQRHAEHEVEDPLVSKVAEVVASFEDPKRNSDRSPLLLAEVLRACDLPADRQAAANRVSKILRQLGLVPARDVIGHGRRGPTYWSRPPTTPATVTPLSSAR